MSTDALQETVEAIERRVTMAKIKAGMLRQGWKTKQIPRHLARAVAFSASYGASPERIREMLGHDRKFEVNKTKLLETLKANREKHIVAHKEAKTGYRKAAIDALTEELGKAKDNEKFSLSFHHLPRPRSHEKEYDQVIGLLEMVISDTIEITTSDYQQFVLDKWSWKREWAMSNSTYAVSAAGSTEEEDED